MKIATLILAAGNATRMQQPKQLLPLENSTMLGVVINNVLKLNRYPVFVVLGAAFDDIKMAVEKLPITIIRNSNYKEGLSTSIKVGISQLLEYDAVLIVLGDQPKIKSDYFNKLIKEFINNPNTVIATDYKTINGVPAIFPKKYYSELLQLKGDNGAKKLLNSNKLPVKKIKTLVNLIDIDTPEAYQNLIKRK